MRRTRPILLLAVAALTTSMVATPASAAPAETQSFTILHTNDFHGNLEWKSGGSTSNPGSARVAAYINGIRASVGAAKTILVDAGDEMQGSLLSNIQQGEPTIATFNAMGYGVATFGNHEFDWGKDVLAARVDQATYPFVSANIVVNDTGSCATAGWTKAPFVDAPYEIKTIGSAPNAVKAAFIGVTSQETPVITTASATAGLCFKDPAESIAHYYDAMKADGADVIVVLSHLGYPDGGYGYGVPIYGDQTLATKLINAGKPADLIIGGHSHSALASATVVQVAGKAGKTTIGHAAYNGRRVGRANITVAPSGAVTVDWTVAVVPTAADAPVDAAVADLIAGYASDPDYTALINQEIGWTNVPIARNYDGDSLMGAFVNDAIYGVLNSDAVAANDVDIVFNNPGGLRADIACETYPCKLTYGSLFSILPFGNQTITGTMTGAQIMELLNQSASLNKGALQVSGIRYGFYNYRKDLDETAAVNYKAWSWGAFDACVIDKTDKSCDPLDLTKTYRIATNEFLAPAGQDNFYAFKYVKNIAYWGDMLNQVIAWVDDAYPMATPFAGTLDGRIARDGNDASGSIVPITILHHNDSHGNLAKGTYVGYTQLATLIKQERSWNPDRTLLLSGGDNIQGDAMSYYFKSAPLGHAADGTPLAPSLQVQPLIAAFNAMGYDAMTLGNHEFNFGSEIFKAVLSDATFPILGANVADTGAYGLEEVGVEPYVTRTVGPEGIKVAILGISNHRVPSYELPSNIPGLTFSDPLVTAQQLSSTLGATTDAIVALTHIGFTEDPKSVEVDKNVDTNLAKTVSGIDVILGSHSHTNPASGFGDTKYLPTIVPGPGQLPVFVSQAYRYNNTLGELFLGFRPKTGGGYELVSRAGQYLSVANTEVEDAAIKAIVDPYVAALAAYNTTEIGTTTAPIDALSAFTQETNGANLQADASVWKLESEGIDVDVHLSGAMTNRKVADAATPASPVTLKVSDMFAAMPYENSLVVMRMNGPELKAVLERAYRNYYFYKYVPGYGGYSYYTTCMLDTDALGRIVYRDTAPAQPDGDNVTALFIDGQPVDFTDADTYYRVSTVNYLAAGACNFSDNGKTLWPLDRIVADTQYYVRDAVIEYIDHEGKVSPAIEGRIAFGPVVGDTDDAGAGSLRAAIKEANERPGADMIVFDDVEGTISLATSLPTITDDVIITGPGAGDLAISGNGRRILSVAEGATVTISGFSFRNGAAGRGAGGAIANAGELTLDGVRFLDNAATYGGAVDNTGSLTVRDTTFSGNEAVAAGGAISSDGTLVIERSTFSDNAAGLSGGALDSSGTLTATNATFAANAAGNKGGAIYVAGGESTLTNLTVSGNRVLNPGATGGGLHLAAGVVDLRATIVANSTAGGDCVKAGGATIRTDVDNLVEDGSCATGSTSRATGDPNLGALAANGGPTRTMALHVPSPAIDAADNGSCPAVDQRGSTRARSLGDPCDIGAFEATDRALPIVTVPGVTPNTGATIRASGLAVSVAWNGSDVGSGVASYEVERSIAGGAWTTVKAGLTTPVLVTRVPFTGTARFRVRAIDAAGNIGAWAYGPTLTASLIQQTDHAIRYNEPWTTSRSDRYSGGSVLWADDKGDYATFTFTGRGVAVVSTLAPSRGRVRVYVDGTYRATVDLHAASVTGRVVVWQGTWAKSATRTIKLVVAGTAGRPRVDLDAFVVVK